MTPERLHVPSGLWRTTLNVLMPYWEGRVEGGCLWYGQRTGTDAYAGLVGVPAQINRPRNFEIPSGALAELNALIPEDMVVVAQIHSHPGQDTTHSPWDDAMMVSRKTFSLVLPHYAAPSCTLATVGLHAYDGARWVKLEPSIVTHRLLPVTESDNNTQSWMVDAR